MIDTPAIGHIEPALSDEIPSLLVPIAHGKLLLPTVSVAEMLPYKEPQSPRSEHEVPEWYIGDLIWRGIMVPMISFEGISGDEIPEIKSTSQISVLNNTIKAPGLPFFCFPTQGIPRLSRVTHDEISENKQLDKRKFYQMHVSVAGEQAIIPDVATIERCLIESLRL